MGLNEIVPWVLACDIDRWRRFATESGGTFDPRLHPPANLVAFLSGDKPAQSNVRNFKNEGRRPSGGGAAVAIWAPPDLEDLGLPIDLVRQVKASVACRTTACVPGKSSQEKVGSGWGEDAWSE